MRSSPQILIDASSRIYARVDEVAKEQGFSRSLFALMFEAKRRAGMLPELRTALMAAYSHIPKILKEGQEAGKIVAGDPDRLALTIGAALHGLVAMSIEGKIRGAALKAIVPETVQHVLNGLSTNKT